MRQQQFFALDNGKEYDLTMTNPPTRRIAFTNSDFESGVMLEDYVLMSTNSWHYHNIKNYKYMYVCTSTNNNLGTGSATLKTPSVIAMKSDIYINNPIVFNKNDFEVGYLNGHGNAVISDSNYYASPYIPVMEGRKVKVTNFTTTANYCFHIFDADKNYIIDVLGGSNSEVITEREFDLPLGAAYIRYTVRTGQLATTNVVYKDEQKDFYNTDKLVQGWYNAGFKRNINLLQTARSKPVITLIDDDSSTISSCTKFHDLCVANGIVGDYAVLTIQLQRHEGLKELLKNYEKEGFHMSIHGHSQQDFYNTGSTRNLAQLQADFVRGMQEMNEYGFTDWNFWVTPYGVHDADVQNLARKWGLKCIVSFAINDYIGDNPKGGRYFIPRTSLNQTDNTYNQTMAGLKAIMDETYENHGWLLLGTHIAEWNESIGYDRFNEAIQYAKNKGFEFKTLNEAFRLREPIFNYYEMY